MSSMREALETSIEAALSDGIIDEKRHGALITGARSCADLLDASDAPNAALFTTMLNFLKALDLLPDSSTTNRKRKPSDGKPNKLEEFRSRRMMVRSSSGATFDKNPTD